MTCRSTRNVDLRTSHCVLRRSEDIPRVSSRSVDFRTQHCCSSRSTDLGSFLEIYLVVKLRRSRTTAWHEPILHRFGGFPVASAPISGFTRGELKPTRISGHAPRSYTNLGRPFRERAGEHRFGEAPADRTKPRRFGVFPAGICRFRGSRRNRVIH